MGAVKSNCAIINGVSMSISIVWYINLLMIINSRRLNLIMTISSAQAQRVKNLPAVQETWVQSLGQEDPLKKRMATHSSILA